MFALISGSEFGEASFSTTEPCRHPVTLQVPVSDTLTVTFGRGEEASGGVTKTARETVERRPIVTSTLPTAEPNCANDAVPAPASVNVNRKFLDGVSSVAFCTRTTKDL